MRRVMVLVCVCSALPGLAQKEELFGTGKPPTFREEAMDRKFNKSKFAKMLAAGSAEPGCIELMGGMFVALAEVIPSLHKRDENFALDPVLIDAVNTQLSTARFPAMAYLALMVRKVMIEKRMPDEWLATAQDLNKTVKIIDVAKLKMLNEQLMLADSWFFTIPKLNERYYVEAVNANSAVTTDVLATFRDTYLDRDISWGGAIVVDVGVNQPKGKKKRRFALAEPEELVAVLSWTPPDPRRNKVDLLARAPVKVEPIIIYARLRPKQYIDVEKLHRNQRVLVKGRFWEMNRTAKELEVREALVFNDPDFSNGVLLGNPQDIDTCPAAINEITGLAPTQVGGFKH